MKKVYLNYSLKKHSSVSYVRIIKMEGSWKCIFCNKFEVTPLYWSLEISTEKVGTHIKKHPLWKSCKSWKNSSALPPPSPFPYSPSSPISKYIFPRPWSGMAVSVNRPYPTIWLAIIIITFYALLSIKMQIQQMWSNEVIYKGFPFRCPSQSYNQFCDIITACLHGQ